MIPLKITVVTGIQTVLFSIFIRPIYNIEDLTTYADDNYLGAENRILLNAIDEIKRKITRVSDWLTNSGLKINEKKTDI